MTNIVLAVVFGIVIVTLTVAAVVSAAQYKGDVVLLYIVPVGTCIAGLAALIVAAVGTTIVLGWGIAAIVVSAIFAIVGGWLMSAEGDIIDGIATAGNFIAIAIGFLMMVL